MGTMHEQANREMGPGARNVLPELPATLPHDMRKEMNWVDFSNPVNPLGTPRVLVNALHAALVDGELSYRPDRTGYALRRILAAYNEIPIESILVGSSPYSLMRSAIQAMGRARVGVSVPCAIEHQLTVLNGGSEFVPLANPFSFAPCKYLIAYHECSHFDAALLANPGFPASRLLSGAVLVEYLENCRWVVVDESHLELSLGGESAIPLTKRYRNLVVVRDASATFAMPGEPLSYLVAHPDTLMRIAPFADPNSIGMSGEVLASVFPQTMGYLEQTRDYLEREIPWLQCMLSLVPGIRIYPAEGNFVLCRFAGEGMDLGVPDAKELSIRLQLTGLLVPQLQRVVGLEDQDQYFCIAAQKRQHDQKLIETMKRIISG